MHIGNIATVGIDNQAFKKKLGGLGYSVIPVDDIHQVITISDTFDLMLVRGNLLADISNEALERIYFTNNSTPVALLIKDPKTITGNLLKTIKNGSFDILYDSEIESDTIYPRIDKLFINSKLNNKLDVMQRDFHSRETLQKEITLREQILNHERVVNTNIIASITSGLIIIDINGTIILANEHTKHVLNNPDAEIIGTSYSSSLPTEISDMIQNFLKKIEKSHTRIAAKKFKIKDSFFNIYCYRMLDYQNNPTGILMLINDITEQETLNTSLYRSEKLATIGTMLSGIAHELRNPLAIVSARTQRALDKNNYEKEWINKTFQSIDTQTKRCASIVNNLLNFARNTATASGFHKIKDILDETLSYVNYQNVFDNITVEKKYKDDLFVYGDRSRFVQIFLNLITNAADAMEGKGELKIITRQAGNAATTVEINDTGPGIDEELKNKIFDPFFTTKDPGKGTGLGLSIVYKIVEESNGKIWLNSKPGNTSFFVELPSKKERLYDSTYSSR